MDLVKPEFIAGDEKRFLDFVKNINENDKVALVSHVADLDGIVSAKVANSVIGTKIIRFADYQDINKNLVEELNKLKVNKIVMTDLMVKDVSFIKEAEKFAEILIIDHHTVEVNHNSEKTVFLNSQGFCAAYLAYYLFSKIKNLEEYDWLVAAASVSDWCYTKNSEWMQAVYNKYNQNFIPTIEGIKKSKFWDIVLIISRAIIYFRPHVENVYSEIGGEFGNVENLKKYSDVIAKEINKIIDNFEKEKVEIKDGYYFEFYSKYPLKSIIATETSERNIQKSIFILSKDERYLEISARRQDGKIDLNILIKKLISGLDGASGGGHFKAIGGFVLLKDAEEFKKRLRNL